MQGLSSKIQNVVMLMLENRSLDNLFGHLYDSTNPPARFLPKGSKPQYDGIPAGATNPVFNWLHELREHHVEPIPVERILADGRDPSVIPWWDPTEEIVSFFGTGHGVINQLFGDQHRVSDLPEYGTVPRMRGFLQDYSEVEAEYPYKGRDILWTFQRHQLPNLYRAAEMGAISDAWFASVPTDTNPNRAFSLCGTSLGRDRNSHISAIEQFDAPTLFNGLSGLGKSCGLYYHDIWRKHLHQCYTQYTFPQSTEGLHEIDNHVKFFTRAADGTLPSFSYLEPQWGGGISADILLVQGQDLHPPTSVNRGDQFVGRVVSALAKSPQWATTLLIITFDEHGGTYDHVGPAWGAVNPDGRVSSRFKFDLFGVRVSTILISPYIAPRTVFRAPLDQPYPFDHTSILSTLMGWAGGSGSAFHKRAAVAPSFAEVLSASDEEAADHAAEIQKACSAPLPAPECPNPVRTSNALFEGIGAASVRWILRTSRSAAEVVRKIEDYRRDPEGFEVALTPPDQP
jgi:phospholipase C